MNPSLRTYLLCGLIASGLGFTPFSARAAEKTLIYDLYAGGVHALDASIKLDEGNGRYALTLDAATAKAFRFIAPWSGTFATKGWLEKEGRHPETHNVVSHLSKKTKTKDIVYKREGGLVSFKATQDGKDKTPEKIDADITPPEIVDVLTATLQTLDRVHQNGNCAGKSLIFDGERSFSLNFTDQGKEALPASVYNVYQGEAVACSFEMKPEKGKWKKELRGWMMLQDQARKLDDKPTVWFARVPGDTEEAYVPVKLQIKTNYGVLILHLREAASEGRVFAQVEKKK
jgi:hypothetical protein